MGDGDVGEASVFWAPASSAELEEDAGAPGRFGVVWSEHDGAKWRIRFRLAPSVEGAQMSGVLQLSGDLDAHEYEPDLTWADDEWAFVYRHSDGGDADVWLHLVEDGPEGAHRRHVVGTSVHRQHRPRIRNANDGDGWDVGWIEQLPDQWWRSNVRRIPDDLANPGGIVGSRNYFEHYEIAMASFGVDDFILLTAASIGGGVRQGTRIWARRVDGQGGPTDQQITFGGGATSVRATGTGLFDRYALAYRITDGRIYAGLLQPDAVNGAAQTALTIDNGAGGWFPAGAPDIVWTGGELGVAWVDGRDGPDRVWFNRLDLDLGLTRKLPEDVELGAGAISVLLPKLAFGDRRYAVVWREFTDAGQRIRLAQGGFGCATTALPDP